MKIVLNTENLELYNTFARIAKDKDYQIVNAKLESALFDAIENNNVDAYILSSDMVYFKKAVEFIKKKTPYVPVICLLPPFLTIDKVPNVQADIIMEINGYDTTVISAFHNLNVYIKTFATLQKLTAKMHDKIEFANCTYDPTRRLLYYKGKEIKKLSAKEGGILEVLASSYGEVVKKEVILEKVWRKTDYFAGRSMDVYITYLRNTLKNNKIKLTIKNISGIGLILE